MELADLDRAVQKTIRQDGQIPRDPRDRVEVIYRQLLEAANSACHPKGSYFLGGGGGGA